MGLDGTSGPVLSIRSKTLQTLSLEKFLPWFHTRIVVGCPNLQSCSYREDILGRIHDPIPRQTVVNIPEGCYIHRVKPDKLNFRSGVLDDFGRQIFDAVGHQGQQPFVVDGVVRAMMTDRFFADNPTLAAQRARGVPLHFPLMDRPGFARRGGDGGDDEGDDIDSDNESSEEEVGPPPVGVVGRQYYISSNEEDNDDPPPIGRFERQLFNSSDESDASPLLGRRPRQGRPIRRRRRRRHRQAGHVQETASSDEDVPEPFVGRALADSSDEE